MRKIIVLSFITLDGVMQAPGGPEEDPSEDFKYGGWSAPFDDEAAGKVMQKQLEPAEIFANYWPEHADYWPGVIDVAKYALSNTLTDSDPIVARWKNSVIIKSVEDIKKLKNSEGPDLKIWGSSKLVQLLLKHDLVDEFWLNIHPVVLGKGKRLFGDDAMPRSFTLVESTATPSGVILANYKRAGEVKTGIAGA